MREARGLNIVCISPAPWDYPIWTNRQHIMERLSEDNQILYLFHPIYMRSSLKRNLMNKSNGISMLKKIKENLYIYTPYIFPFDYIFPGIREINIRISSIFLKRELKRLGFGRYILWFYDPEAAGYLNCLNPVFTCYDCVDEFSKMPFYSSEKRRQRLISREEALIKRSNVVFTTSSSLFNQKIKVNPNTFLVENVGDFKHFNKADTEILPLPEDLPVFNGPVIGFIGALDQYKVDFDLIEYMAAREEEWSIILIGSRMDRGRKKNLPERENIHYLGRKEYGLLPAYIARFNVCIIPYILNDYTRSVFPVKFFEFLATGRPVVSTPLPALEKYNKLIDIAGGGEGFTAAVKKALYSDTQSIRKSRIELARENDWSARAGRLIKIIREHLKDKDGFT